MAGLVSMTAVDTIATRNHLNWEEKYIHTAVTSTHYTTSYLFPTGSVNIIEATISVTEALNTMRSQYWVLSFAWKVSQDDAFSSVVGAGITTVAMAYDFDGPLATPVLAATGNTNGFRIGCAGSSGSVLYYHVKVKAQTLVIVP